MDPEPSTLDKLITYFGRNRSQLPDDERVNVANVDEILQTVVTQVLDVYPEIFRLPQIIRRFEDHYDPKLLCIGLYGRQGRTDQDHKNMENFKERVRKALVRVLKKQGRRKPTVVLEEKASAERNQLSDQKLSEEIWSELIGKVIPEVHRGGEKILALYDDIDAPTGIDNMNADTAERARYWLVLDGVFLTCFLIFLAFEDWGDSADEKFQAFLPVINEFRSIKVVTYQELLISDMWLFENQVPFVVMRRVLEALHFELVGKDDEIRVEGGLRRLVKKAIGTVLHLLPGDCIKEKSNVREIERRIDNIPLEKCKHLLECLYRVVCPNVMDTPISKSTEAIRSSTFSSQSDEFECLFGPAKHMAAKASDRNINAEATSSEKQVNRERQNDTHEADHESVHASGDGRGEGEGRTEQSVSSTTNVRDADTGSAADLNEAASHATVQIERHPTLIQEQMQRPWKFLAKMRTPFGRSSRGRLGVLNGIVPSMSVHPSFSLASHLVPSSAAMGTEVGASIIDIFGESGVQTHPLPTLERALPVPVADVAPPNHSDIVAASVSEIIEATHEIGGLSVPEPEAVQAATVSSHASLQLGVVEYTKPPPAGDHVPSQEVAIADRNDEPHVEETPGTPAIRHGQRSGNTVESTEPAAVPIQSPEKIVVVGHGLGSQLIRQTHFQIRSGGDIVRSEDLVVVQNNASEIVLLGEGMGSDEIRITDTNDVQTLEERGIPKSKGVDFDLSEIEVSQEHDNVHEGLGFPEVGGTPTGAHDLEFPEEGVAHEGKLKPAAYFSEEFPDVDIVPDSQQDAWVLKVQLGIGHVISTSFVYLVTVMSSTFRILDWALPQNSYFDEEQQDIPYASPVKRLPQAQDYASDDYERQLQTRQARNRHLSRSIETELPTASELRKAGIIVEGDSEPGCKVRFSDSWRRPVLYVSKLRIELNTERLLQNLVAFELQFMGTHVSHKDLLMTYLANMNELVNTEEDVRCLKSGTKPVITRSNLGTDALVADVFNRMIDHSSAGDTELRELRRRVNTCSHSNMRRGCTEFLETQLNCRKPWIVISLLAGAIILLLTAVQTTIAVLEHF